MRRRHLLIALPSMLAMPAVVRAGADATTLDATLRWLDALERSAPGAVRTTGAWPVGTVLQHAAQSIQMSVDGYPAPRGAVFQATVGSAAFSWFKWKGRMTHALDEPIPGAPPLPASSDIAAGAARLRRAIARFNAHSGPLAAHFAYGALDKRDYALAHALHIANHREEIRGA
jgi:hypothetical protein